MSEIRKVRMTMPHEVPMIIIEGAYKSYGPHKKKKLPEPLFIFSLDNFEIKDGNVKWIMRDLIGGGIITGNLGNVELGTIKDHGKVEVALSLPVNLHKQGLYLNPEFMIMLPEHLRVYSLNTLKKEFGTKIKLFR